MGRKDYAEEQVLSAFEKFSAQQATQLRGEFPVRLATFRLRLILNNQFTNAELRDACRRLVAKGILREDHDYSAVNSLTWRYK